MRFAYLCCDFGVPYFGNSGSSIHVRETVSALRRLGHDVEVFCAVRGSAEAFTDAVHSVVLGDAAASAIQALLVGDLEEQGHVAKEVRSLLVAEAAQGLLPALQDYAPNVIYERYALFAYAGVTLARRLGIPHILEVNAPLQLEQENYRELVLRHTATALEREIYCASDALVVVSEALAQHAMALGVPRNRITVLPNGVDAALFDPATSGVEVRRRHRLENARVVGFVGSLKPWHDLETLLVAFERVRARSDPPVRLLIVGDGPAREQFGREGASVVWTGTVDHEQVPAHLAAMDVVAAPYAAGEDAYFSPIKVFEAMAMGKPVVGARAGQVADLIDDGVTGLLYAPGDADDLANRLLTALALPNGGERMGRAARAFVLAQHTWIGNGERITALARSLQRTREMMMIW